ncbi:MAG: 16S rRNA (guanine(527)-N(7))-methyltransferase RsmG [Bacteroidales bacterium]|nr:16S rRNA (guanine(527)-N(7))-methyltransferase RsmG [Bacteroidales bacterium]
MNLILKYFPQLHPEQKSRFAKLGPLYESWNSKINVISRKDMEHFYERHVLHSLSISNIIRFPAGSQILDVGTGGGFPGIPLAILFPDCHFHLVDSIGKKVMVVDQVMKELKLTNVTCEKSRAESLNGQYEFIVSRAVTALPVFAEWVKKLILQKQDGNLQNGIFYLKGGEFSEELRLLKLKSHIYPISKYFEEPFFETKAIVHLYR